MQLFAHIFQRLSSGNCRKKNQRSRSFDSQLLESRILPATMVSPFQLTYQDVDGDNVSVTFSNRILTPTNVNTIFKFNTGTVDGSNALKQQLRQINLAPFASADGTSITTVSTRLDFSFGGDGFAAVGEINAIQRDLGIVTIDGDLGRVIAGNSATNSFGVRQLIVQSMGRFGKSTGASDLHSQILGPVDVVSVKTDIKAGFVEVYGGTDGADGRISKVTIGGSVIGGALKDSGRIHSTGTMGKVRIGGDLHGGTGIQTGIISSFSNIAEVIVAGSIIGGSNSYAGGIITDFKGGGPKVGEVGANIGTVTISGDVIGGSSIGSGSIISESGSLGPVTISGSLLGGDGDRSAQIFCQEVLSSVTIEDDVIGGKGAKSAEIEALRRRINYVGIAGSMQGGKGDASGSVFAAAGLGELVIGGDLVGGAGANSGSITNAGSGAGLEATGPVTIRGSLRGGDGEASGRIDSKSNVGAVEVYGSIIGGMGKFSGSIQSQSGSIASITIGGSLVGGSSNYTGSIFAWLDIGTVSVMENIRGGSQTGTLSLGKSGTIESGGTIRSLTVHGSIIAGIDNTTGIYKNNAAIIANNDIVEVIIGGSIIGNETAAVLISARGKSQPPVGSDIAIGSVNVAGRVERALIIAGQDRFGRRNNADAQITSVTVDGDWIASSLVAGADTGTDGLFGTQDDVQNSGAGVRNRPNIMSAISNLSIGGQVIGSDGTADHFGIVAEYIGTLTINGDILRLFPGAHNDHGTLSADIDSLFSNVSLSEL